MDQVNLAEHFLAVLPPEAHAVLVTKEELDVEETPRNELPRQPGVLTPADFAHKVSMEDVFVVDGEPHVILLPLHLAQDLVRVRRLERRCLRLRDA